MIEFACHCKHRFSLPDDQAGGVIQCRECGRLNDIPTLDDLPHLDADGVFDIYAERPTDDSSRLAALRIIYAKGTRDADGDEIDLRGSIAPAGEPDEIPLADEGPADRPRPKYDPETGELIRPLDVKEDPDRPTPGHAIPLAQPVIGYATPNATDLRRISPWGILIELFAPGNVMVMAFVVVTCVLLVITAIITNYGMVFVVVAPVLLLGALVSHFGITIEEIGPLEQDELPRMLRSLSWHDDLWGPFKKVTGAAVLAFWPAYAATRLPPVPMFLVLTSAVMVGLFFLPALLLTTTTSGTWLNLRPDRLLGVIRAAGSHYVVAVVGGAASFLTFLPGLVGSSVAVWNALTKGDGGGWLGKWFVAFPLLAAGIYATHAWAWYLGLMYRAHHGQFPWVLQRHVSTRRTSLDPATDVFGRAHKPRRSTEEKLMAIREAERRKRAAAQASPKTEPDPYQI